VSRALPWRQGVNRLLQALPLLTPQPEPLVNPQGVVAEVRCGEILASVVLLYPGLAVAQVHLRGPQVLLLLPPPGVFPSWVQRQNEHARKARCQLMTHFRNV
jgi:hypothetical protein